MLDPDPQKRRENLRYIAERLQLAEAVGARCCRYRRVVDPNFGMARIPRIYRKEFFDATVENCCKVIDDVKPKNTKFSIEMMPWSLPDGPDSYVKLIHAIDRQV